MKKDKKLKVKDIVNAGGRLSRDNWCTLPIGECDTLEFGYGLLSQSLYKKDGFIVCLRKKDGNNEHYINNVIPPIETLSQFQAVCELFIDKNGIKRKQKSDKYHRDMMVKYKDFKWFDIAVNIKNSYGRLDVIQKFIHAKTKEIAIDEFLEKYPEIEQNSIRAIQLKHMPDIETLLLQSMNY